MGKKSDRGKEPLCTLMPTTAKARPPGSPRWVTGAQALGSASAASQMHQQGAESEAQEPGLGMALWYEMQVSRCSLILHKAYSCVVVQGLFIWSAQKQKERESICFSPAGSFPKWPFFPRPGWNHESRSPFSFPCGWQGSKFFGITHYFSHIISREMDRNWRIWNLNPPSNVGYWLHELNSLCHNTGCLI